MPTKIAQWMRPLGFAAAALVAGSAVAAEGPRYTYGEIGYERVDFDNFSEDADVGSIGGSLAMTDNLYLVAAYSYGKIDDNGFDIELDNFDAGLGVHFPVADRVDLIGEVAYAWAKVDVDRFGSEDDDGVALKAGVRAMLTPEFELNGGATYVDISGDDNTAGYVGVVYNFTPMFAVTGDVTIGDNATAYGIGLRMYFDK